MKKYKKVEDDQQALLQMYQAGFLDGFNSERKYRLKFKARVKKLCIHAFEHRFGNLLQGNVKLSS